MPLQKAIEKAIRGAADRFKKKKTAGKPKTKVLKPSKDEQMEEENE